MTDALRSSGSGVAAGRYAHPVAFSIHLSRNVVVQGLGLSMVALMGLDVAPWPVVLAWTLCAVGVIGAEHRLLHLLAAEGARAARIRTTILRTLTTSLYALAALALIVRGGLGDRFFAFALMSASMVHVMMRHYMSPRVLLTSLSPYLVVLSIVGVGLSRQEWSAGRTLGTVAPVFTIALVAIQFWSARAQLAGAWRELTAARQAAEQRERAAAEANRAKSQFLATMSHELRTPLNGVLGMAHALENDRLTPVQRDRVEVIRQSGEGLLVVLNDLLDLSTIETRAMRFEPVEFDLDVLLREVVAVYQPLAFDKGLTFVVETGDGVACRYLGDPIHIRRIVHGLCDNAVKFTETGGVILAVGRARAGVTFALTDSGPGIEAVHLSRLFEGFYQADSSSTRQYGGAGIGLAICNGLATLMGGSVEASSAVGRGSTFTLRLPLERMGEGPRPADACHEPAPRTELRVLAAEDNLVNQRVLKTLLAPAGIEPTLVENGRDVLVAWESQAWDIVLMDIRMPVMDGMEAARQIRRRERQTGRSRTPIVAVTANALTHQRAEYEAAGIDGVVAKPFDVGGLFRAIDVALDEGRRQAAVSA